MQDLVICVGEKCHQAGAEVVLKSFMDIIAREKLEEKVCLKGSFCIGECYCEDGSDHETVSVRLGEKVFQVDPKDAFVAFARDVWPAVGNGPAPTLIPED